MKPFFRSSIVAAISLLSLLAAVSCSGGKEPARKPLPEGAVPFVYYLDHIYLSSFLEDSTECDIVFDTGAGLGSLYLYLDSTFRSECRPAFLDSSRLTMALYGGVGEDRYLTKLYKDSTVLVSGGLELPHAGVLFVNLRDVLGRKADGIAGIRLDGSAWEINYERHYLRKLERVQVDSLGLEGFSAFPMKIEDGRLLVYCDVRLSDGVSSGGWFILDTGSGSSIFFTADEAAAKGFGSAGKPVCRYAGGSRGLGGETVSCIADAEYAVFGNDTLRNIEIEWYEGKNGVMAGGSYKGIIGNELLERYNVVLDLRDSLIYLQRNPAYEVPRDGKPWGISFVDRTDIGDAWIASAIRVGGPADEAGMSPGDSVVSINGKPVTGLDVEEVYAVMDSLSVLNLVLKDGRDVKDLRIVCGNENL